MTTTQRIATMEEKKKPFPFRSLIKKNIEQLLSLKTDEQFDASSSFSSQKRERDASSSVFLFTLKKKNFCQSKKKQKSYLGCRV